MHSIGKILVRPFGGGKTDRLAKKADGGEMVLGGLKMAGWNVLMMILAMFLVHVDVLQGRITYHTNGKLGKSSTQNPIFGGIC